MGIYPHKVKNPAFPRPYNHCRAVIDGLYANAGLGWGKFANVNQEFGDCIRPHKGASCCPIRQKTEIVCDSEAGTKPVFA
jgi:hypothetical protein